MRSSGRRRDEEGRCKEAEKGEGRGLNGTKGGEERGRGGPVTKKRRKERKNKKKRKKMRTLEIGIRAGSACNDRFVNAHVILHAIYPSGTFSAEKACFSLKIKNLTNQTCFFVFFLFPSFFLDFDSFLFRFFLSKRKRNFICLTFFFQSSLTTSLEWISDYESFPFPLDTMPMYFA